MFAHEAIAYILDLHQIKLKHSRYMANNLTHSAVAWSQKISSSTNLNDRRSNVNTFPLLVPM